MTREDIIRQFGEAKYKAALESAKQNNFQSIDELLIVALCLKKGCLRKIASRQKLASLYS